MIRLGDGPPPRRFGPITQTDLVRFAGAGGDFNPLHHDPAAALTAGFDRPIAMGQFTAGLLAAWLTDWCGITRLRAYRVRFTAPLSIGDTVELSGEVIAVRAEFADLDLAVRSGNRTIVTGHATIHTTAPG